jgi:periplasmic protein TonB
MIAKVLVMTFAVGGVALAQSQTFSSCSTELSKTDGIQRIRVSTGVSEALIEKRVLPATSDLDKKLTSQVIVKTLIDKKGAVRCAEAVQGDTTLFQRSTEAALQWRFKPYILNAQPIIVETPIEFDFSKRKVKAR